MTFSVKKKKKKGILQPRSLENVADYIPLIEAYDAYWNNKGSDKPHSKETSLTLLKCFSQAYLTMKTF